MIGSVLVNYSELTSIPANPRWEVRVNGILVGSERDLQYTKANKLYSTRVSPGDTLTVGIFGLPLYKSGSIGVYRKDYTTDDEGGDNGIKIISVTGRTGNNGSDGDGGFCVLYNIPITTRPDAYGFEYIIDLSIIPPDFTAGTGSSSTNSCSAGPSVPIFYVGTLPTPLSGATCYFYLNAEHTVPAPGEPSPLWYSDGTYSYLVTNAGTGQVRDVRSCDCLSYTITNSGVVNRDLLYTNCIDTLSSKVMVPGETITICAKGFSLKFGLTITEIGICP